jgi:NAD+ kinase
MHLALVLHPANSMASQTAGELLSMAARMQLQVHAARKITESVPTAASLSNLLLYESDREAIDHGEITVAIGGDGTILRTAHIARETKRPILGINSGKLGFLANIQRQNLEQALQEVVEGKFQLDRRSFLEAEFSNGDVHFALNEFVFSRKGTVSMITLTAEYDGALINRYWADGIIVSSPTGSTAYNLSTGGPIVMPQTNVMVLTPISPHTLTTRPLVLPSKKKLTIKVEPTNQEVLFSGDGINYELPGASPQVHIRQSDHYIDLIGLSEHSYFETLRNKLMWGADVREIK